MLSAATPDKWTVEGSRTSGGCIIKAIAIRAKTMSAMALVMLRPCPKGLVRLLIDIASLLSLSRKLIAALIARTVARFSRFLKFCISCGKKDDQ